MRLARGNVKGTVAIINRAAITVRIKFNHTAGVLTNSDTNESRIRLSLGATKTVAITVLDLTGVRVAGEVCLALKLAWGRPAISLDGELAAVAGVVTGGVVVGIGLVINSFTGLIQDSKACVVAIGITAGGTGDC